MLGRLFATWYELDTKVEPKAKAMAQVRAKPVMRGSDRLGGQPTGIDDLFGASHLIGCLGDDELLLAD